MPDRTFDEALSGLESGVDAGADPGAPRGESADAAAHPSVAALRAVFGDVVLHHTVMSGDEHVVYVHPDRVRDVLQWLRDDAGQRYDLLLDVSAVDYAGGRPLEVFYQLWSIEHKRALRIKATLPLAALEIDSAVPVWSTANWLERETYDMFGIRFRGHPDLRRIMMPDNYAEGHPLRKDFPLRGRFSRAEQTRRALSMAVEDFYTADELRTAGVAQPGAAPSSTGSVSATGGITADTAPGTEATPNRPNDAGDWTLGASGSAADGTPGPGGAAS